MGIGYTRNDTPNNIANGNVIAASDLDGEFDAIVAAFNETTGHTHDGTADEGGAISVLGPVQEYLGDGSAFYPKTTAVYTLGKVSNTWANLYLDVLTLGGTAVTSTAAELNKLDGYTGTFSDLNKIAAVTATAAELNVLDGVAATLTFTELNYVDGVTSAIQTQLNNKQPLDSVLTATTASFLTADETKLDGIEALADVTDVTNVTAAGALMDSELTNLAAVKAINQSLVTTASPTFNQGNFTTVDTTNLEVTTLKAKDGVAAGGIASVTGVTTLNSAVLTTADINGGTVDGASIGATTRSTGLFTTLGTNSLATLASVDINGGNIDGTVIGAGTPAAGTFTALTSNGIDDNAAATAMTLDASGNVLVGKTVTNVGIGVEMRPNGFLYSSVSGTTSAYFERNTSHGELIRFIKDGVKVGGVNSASGGGLAFTSDSTTTERFFLDQNGRLGIGTSTPDSALDIDTGSASQTAVTLQGAAATSAKLQLGLGMFSAGFPTVLGTANGLDLGTSASAPVRFFTNSTEVGRIAGSVLTLGGTNTNPSSGNVLNSVAISGSGYIEASRESFAAVDVNRRLTDGAVVLLRKGGTQVGSISVTASATTYNTTSDYRTKENITPVQGAVELVRALNPITYTAISDGQWYDGFLAHEVQGIIPTTVTGELDGVKEEEYEVTPADGDTPAVMGTRTVPDMQSMDYSRLTPILTAGLQAALDKIDALEARIASLEAGV
jgi:hypothetical protein